MNLQTVVYTGALEGKIPFIKILQEFKNSIASIGLVHRRGARKYAAYSWLRDPDKSNSTVWENIDALLRHMTAHSIGLVKDPEGLPHIFHMCCRAGMLVTTYLRKQIPRPFDWPEHALEDSAEYPNIGGWITPEELISLANYYKYPDILEQYKKDDSWDLAALQDHIYSFLINAAITYEDNTDWLKKEKIFSKPSLIENIYILLEKILALSSLDYIDREYEIFIKRQKDSFPFFF
mgnify:CR=1 FL=1